MTGSEWLKQLMDTAYIKGKPTPVEIAETINMAIREEREACAKIADDACCELCAAEDIRERK